MEGVQRLRESEEQRQSHRHPERTASPAEPRQRCRGCRGCAEGLRRDRASPTPTGCARGHPERPQWHDRGAGLAQIPIDMEDAPTAPTEARTAPQTVGGCNSPPTARNAPHRARGSTTQGTAWHGGTASALRPDPAPQPTHSTHTTAEPETIENTGVSQPSEKKFEKNRKKGLTSEAPHVIIQTVKPLTNHQRTAHRGRKERRIEQ